MIINIEKILFHGLGNGRIEEYFEVLKQPRNVGGMRIIRKSLKFEEGEEIFQTLGKTLSLKPRDLGRNREKLNTNKALRPIVKNTLGRKKEFLS